MTDPNLVARLAGSDPGPLEKILLALLHDPELDARIEAADAQTMIVARVGKKAVPVLLLRHRTDDPAFEQRLRAAAATCTHEPAELVVFGGPPELHKRLRRALPGIQPNRLGAYYVSDDRKVMMLSDGKRMTPLWEHLCALEAGTLAVAPADPSRLADRMRRDATEVHERARKVQAFRAFLAGRKPLATWILLGAIAAMFAGTLAFGGTEDMAVLVRSGALSSEAVRDGEWWRLLSAAFLHGGAMHLLMNGAVLFTLGSSLERLLGTRRFVVLYTLSALGGGVASALIRGHGLSVGASGALWGLLAADAVIAFRPAGLIPAFHMSSMRMNAGSMLILNLAVSFRPNVDFAAHLGGGVVGALLMLTGILTHGCPRLDDVAPGAPWPLERRPAWLTPAFGLTSLALAGSLVLALATGRPWELSGAAGRLAWHPIPELKLTVQAPTLISDRPHTIEEDEAILGDPRRDGFAIVVASATWSRVEGDVSMVIAEVKRGLGEAPEGAKLVRDPTHATVDGREIVTATVAYPNGVHNEIAVWILPGRWVRVEVVTTPSQRGRFADLARRLAATITLDPP